MVVESEASGRGRSSLLALPFVSAGPLWEAQINAELFEAVLSRTRRRGPARLLLAAMAAPADADGVVSALSKEELCAAAGIEDRTPGRARGELLECGEVELVEGGGGRGNTNVWQVRALPNAAAAARRVAAPAGARPLLAAVAAPADDNRPDVTGVPLEKGGQDGTVRSLEPAAVFHGLYWLVANLSETRPLLLCVDDAQWCDPASVGWLLYLARRLDDVPVLLIVAVRAGEARAQGGPKATGPQLLVGSCTWDAHQVNVMRVTVNDLAAYRGSGCAVRADDPRRPKAYQ